MNAQEFKIGVETAIKERLTGKITEKTEKAIQFMMDRFDEEKVNNMLANKFQGREYDFFFHFGKQVVMVEEKF